MIKHIPSAEPDRENVSRSMESRLPKLGSDEELLRRNQAKHNNQLKSQPNNY